MAAVVDDPTGPERARRVRSQAQICNRAKPWDRGPRPSNQADPMTLARADVQAGVGNAIGVDVGVQRSGEAHIPVVVETVRGILVARGHEVPAARHRLTWTGNRMESPARVDEDTLHLAAVGRRGQIADERDVVVAVHDPAKRDPEGPAPWRRIALMGDRLDDTSCRGPEVQALPARERRSDVDTLLPRDMSAKRDVAAPVDRWVDDRIEHAAAGRRVTGRHDAGDGSPLALQEDAGAHS